MRFLCEECDYSSGCVFRTVDFAVDPYHKNVIYSTIYDEYCKKLYRRQNRGEGEDSRK